MSDIQEKKLLVSIIKYFRNKITAGQLSPDQSESLEVAIQCLESGLGVDSFDPSLQTNVDLLSLFSSAKVEPIREPSDLDKAEADRLKQIGNDWMKDGKFQEAVNSYTAAINLHKNPTFYCNRAAAFSKLEKHQSSIDDCKEALQLDPRYSKAYGRMGLAYSCMNRYSDARDAYKKALELEPGNDSFKNNLKIAEDKIEEMSRQGRGATGPFPGMMPPGMPNMAGFNPFEMLNNPGLMQMAQQFMTDPNMQNVLNSFMGGMGGGAPGAPPAAAAGGPSPSAPEPTATGGHTEEQPNAGPQNPYGTPGGLNQLLEMGQRLASQMQQQNPELVEQLRRQFQQQHGPSNEEQGHQDDKNPPAP